MKLLSVALLICAAGPFGPKAQIRDPCKGETTADMKQCAARNFKKADDELNKVYRELMSKLADEGHKASLKTAQQAWLKYRDSNCDFEAYLNRGGTIYSVVVSDCMTTMTASRTKEMKEEIQELESN
jgi:uncharacterized protein YecT (DUF1311 family)